MIIKKAANRLNSVVIFFSMFMALMLFQTSYMNLGTIAAFATMLLTVLAFIFSKKYRVCLINTTSLFLLLFLFISVFTTILHGLSPSYKYVSQIILCFLLFSIDLTEHESKFMRSVFTIASLIYGALTVYSCHKLGDERYFHGGIVLFNATLDPNFIGIPLTAAMTILFYDIMHSGKKMLRTCAYILLAIAIVYTSSRGNFLTSSFSVLLIVVSYTLDKQISLWKKILIICCAFLAIVFMIDFFSTAFQTQWERMSNITGDSDNSRFILWERALSLWWNNPLFGSGIGGNYAIYGKATHNTYLTLLSETGLVGSFLFVGFLINLMKKALYYEKALFYMLLGVMLQIFFLDAIDNRCLWAILCWMAMLPEIGRKRNAQTNIKQSSTEKA